MTRDLWSVDLHSHTFYSDGSQSPEELLLLAKANGVRALSITDHDHTGGIEEALVVGAREGVEIIPGIELSVSHAEFEDIHILGYYLAWRAPDLEARLAEFRVAREARGERILARINEKLLAEGRAPIPYEAVKARVKGAFGRPHIANMLIEEGYVADTNAAFHEYLIPCNVPKAYFSAEEALALIRDVRGISVVAHPGLITPDRIRLSEVLNELRALGLVGIETYHNDHGPDDTRYFAGSAERLGMIVTGGSDYHGFKHRSVDHTAGGKLGGLGLPYGIAERLRREYLARYPIALLLLDWPAAAATALRRALTEPYNLGLLKDPPTKPLVKRDPHLFASEKSHVRDMHSADVAAIDRIVAEGRGLGVRTVGVPWETSRLTGYGELYRTPAISTQRFQRTPVERLAHELVHEVILAQLQ
ncbi:MAG: PHP domain-containing protein [Nitrospinae bacterium]|nr:PHP domain-containing protein [Nitrospinota bacterium]